MDYKRHWRRLHTEVDALAQASDGEQEPHHFSNDESSTGEPHLPNSDQDYVVSDNDEIYHENDWMSTSSDNDTVSTSDDTNGDTADEYVDQEPVADLAEDLAEWATRHKCTRTALNELLNILRKRASPPKRLTYTFKNTTIYQYYTKEWWGLFVSWYRE